MNIHTFGDSHSSKEHSHWRFHNLTNIKDHHLGPRLMNSFATRPFEVCNIKTQRYGVKDNDIVIFCFGEIDCRCHVHKHITVQKSYENIITELVDKYFVAIKRNVQQFNNLFVCVYNVVPPLYTDAKGHPDFPFLGTNEERREYHLFMNKEIKRMCGLHDYYFFDIYEKSCNKDGFINRSYTDNCGVHLRNDKDAKIVIEDILKKAKEKTINK